jgi:hypothetical protein
MIASGSLAALVALAVTASEPDPPPIAFPKMRPTDGNFNRPADGGTLDVSPPGFCWWRAGSREAVNYQLTIHDNSGQQVYQSPRLADPVHVPTAVLPPGAYTWTVVALVDQRVAATLGPRSFRILDNAYELPWVSPAKLLGKVPVNHPRLLFPAAQLDAFRATLTTTRKAAYAELKAVADRALSLQPMPKPTFDRYDRETQYPQRRTAYRASYHQFTITYHQGMLPLAAVYVLSGERRYGEAAKVHLLNLLDWELDGIASLESGFDEIGLRIQRTAAQAYDWLYDLLTPTERKAVKAMLVAHGNAMLARLKERDFLNYSAYSHDGRLPGYLVEFSIALAEEPVAREWMEYAMQALLTVFPHWADADGGWAEGIGYALSYNDRFITPLHSLQLATGYDLWQKEFFRKFRHFAMYNTSPLGEILPFGDGEEKSVASRGDELVSILYFHSLRYQDPVTRWWIDLIPRGTVAPDRLGALHRLLLPDTLAPRPPQELPMDRAFHGVGWAALHTDLLHPEEDLMVMFKSSPFGSVSHSHADQNSFAIMQGGRALAIPGGARFPQHGSPFHEQYTQQTVAHNALLVDGQGQRNRDDTAGGKLVAFRSLPHLAYVAGDAKDCYPKPLTKNLRHVVLVRPSLIIVLDEVEADRPIDVAWLLHTKEESALRQQSSAFTVRRDHLRMAVHLGASTEELSFSQTSQWPLSPKQDYEMVKVPDPPRQWHFRAETTHARNQHRLAAVMLVGDESQLPSYEVAQSPQEMTLTANLESGRAIAMIQLQDPATDRQPILHVQFQPHRGEPEILRVP